MPAATITVLALVWRVSHTLVAFVGSAILLLVVLELVRRRRLFERYAILWLASAIALIALSLWGGLLNFVAGALGINQATNALFAIAFGFVLVLLLHFSIAVSRLSDQSKVLAQRLALSEERLREVTASARRAEAEGQPESELETRPKPVPVPAPARRVAGADGAAEPPVRAARGIVAGRRPPAG